MIHFPLGSMFHAYLKGCTTLVNCIHMVLLKSKA